jgi:hypothetical protein
LALTFGIILQSGIRWGRNPESCKKKTNARGNLKKDVFVLTPVQPPQDFSPPANRVKGSEKNFRARSCIILLSFDPRKQALAARAESVGPLQDAHAPNISPDPPTLEQPLIATIVLTLVSSLGSNIATNTCYSRGVRLDVMEHFPQVTDTHSWRLELQRNPSARALRLACRKNDAKVIHFAF